MARREPGLAEILAALRTFGHAPAARPPGGRWFTLKELAAKDGLSLPSLKYKMMRAEQRGQVFERAIGTMPNKEGIARRAVFFRLKNGKDRK